MTEDWGTNTGWLVVTLAVCFLVAREVVGYLGLTGGVAFVVGLVFIGAPSFTGSMLLYNRIILQDEPKEGPNEAM